MVWIWSEHAIGFLKGHFHSLKWLRVHIKDKKSHKFATYWVAACIGIHSFAMMCESEEWEGNNSDTNENPFIAKSLSSLSVRIMTITCPSFIMCLELVSVGCFRGKRSARSWNRLFFMPRKGGLNKECRRECWKILERSQMRIWVKALCMYFRVCHTKWCPVCKFETQICQSRNGHFDM